VFTPNSPIGRILRIWTDLSQPVGRRLYLTHGLSLAAVKYLGDVLLVYAASGVLWTPTHYVHGLPSLLIQLPASSLWLALALAAWMLPFLAIGMTLSLRRAIDAGQSPWLSILFLVPFVNYALIATLAALPSRPRGHDDRPSMPSRRNPRAAAVAVVAGVLLAVLAVHLGIRVMRTSGYGLWLFVLTPFAMGACTGFFYNHGRGSAGHGTTPLVIGTALAACLVLLVTAGEGAICLVMALPIALPLAALGGVVGRLAAGDTADQAPPLMLMLLVLPLTAAVEPPSGRTMHEVQSSVVIDASPDAIWPHVVAFRPIPAPTDWLFRAGVAYPIRARIEGAGVGAVRYCEFSTGPFVEPITRWEPGHRLSFDVVDSPASMRELSPYRELSPRHLHGYLRSKRGEFRLIDLGDGRTRLEGSTWYEIEMAPEAYWQIFSDALIHRIHQRVLDHIKQEVEIG